MKYIFFIALLLNCSSLDAKIVSLTSAQETAEKVIEHVNNAKLDVNVECVTVPDEYVEHGSVEQLRKEIGIDADSVVERVLKLSN